MSPVRPVIRKMYSQVEQTYNVAGQADEGGVLRKVAVCLVVRNPFAGKGYVADLGDLIDASAECGTLLGEEALRLLDAPAQSYGKAGLVGTAGEQEHINASLTSTFGNALREAVGGGHAWISSVTKPGVPGTLIDVPLAYKDDVWIRSHYDAMEVRVPDAPHPDELVIIAALSNRGRINARVGGRTASEAVVAGGS